jgi:hypothetical protein
MTEEEKAMMAIAVIVYLILEVIYRRLHRRDKE